LNRVVFSLSLNVSSMMSGEHGPAGRLFHTLGPWMSPEIVLVHGTVS